MKKWVRFIFLCSALFTVYGGKAQVSKAWGEEPIPAKIRGNWALPDCKSYEEALIITRYSYLRVDKEGSRFWPLSGTQKQKDYWIISLEGQKHPIRLEADGVLKIGYYPEGTPKKWAKSWDALGLDSKHEYMGCADIPAILPDPLVRAMRHLDEVEDACHESLSGACGQLLFRIADENHNKKISVREFKQAAQMLAAISTVIQNNTVSRENLDKAIYKSMQESDRLTAKLMPHGREMTLKDFEGFAGKTRSTPLHDAMIGASLLIPGFGQ